jgi:hypothetical protein
MADENQCIEEFTKLSVSDVVTLEDDKLVANIVKDIVKNIVIDDEESYTIVDITKSTSIIEKFNESTIKKWIKLIPYSKTYEFDSYKRNEKFIHVANIELDNELNIKGTKKRNTLIRFVPQIELSLYNEESEWIYIFLVNDRIVKIGGTRTGLKGRASSYLCGHHIEERGKSGDCSKTNGYIYNTFYFYLLNNANIKMYAFQIPVVKQVYNILDRECEIKLQTYHAYESIYIEDFKQLYGEIPFLCDNSDPNYQKSNI